MLRSKKDPIPFWGRNDKPNTHSDYYGPEVGNTAHLSVAGLARHLIDELPNRFSGLAFSAIVYRYHLASPWLLDLEVHGLSNTEIREDHHSGSLLDQLVDTVQLYNWDHDHVPRFGSGHVTLLLEHDQVTRTPGRIVVRRYYLATPVREFVAWLPQALGRRR